jgi:hypothetical protein
MGLLWGPIVISGVLSGCGGDAKTASPPADAGSELDVAIAPGVTADAASPDLVPAALPDAGPDRPDGPAAYPRPSYARLAETGLFADPATRTVVAGVADFQPNHVLWSDAAAKRRWVRLPPGAQIDTTEMERWQLPIGTKFWKEFSRDGVLLETRLIERYGPGRDDYWMGAFVWNAAQTEAVFAENGQADINGTTHDAPAQKHCWSCHLGEPGRGLGFSALQLAGPGPGLRLEALAAADRLTNPPARTDFRAPGDPPVAAALGYLHANCGHCHNPNGTSWPDTNLDLRLLTTDTTPEATGAYRTAVSQKLQSFRHPQLTQRVAPGDPAMSALVFRMNARMEKVSMPPLATEVVDMAGLEIVRRWIEALPR